MNDALEGEQVVDVNKAGQSATFNSRVGLLATGNPEESRFDRNLPVSAQLGIDRSLLSRFDAIVAMRDEADREQDENVAETQGRAYVEAQEVQHGDREEFEYLDREVPPDVGRAWVQFARENVTPILKERHVETIKEWYANEVRQLNNDLQDGDAGDMPVPVSARAVQNTIRFSVAFARVHFRDEVADVDVERAMALSKTLIGQTFDGETFQPETSKSATQNSRKDRILKTLDGEAKSVDAVANATGLDEETVAEEIETLAHNGRIIEPKTGVYRSV
jgi:DNA replication licensing factor MCM4